MDERVLAEGPFRIALGRMDRGVSLSITDGVVVRFVAETAALESVFEGVPLQLSELGSYCRVEAYDSRIRFDFMLAGTTRGSCSLPKADFSEALAWVRAWPPRENA